MVGARQMKPRTPATCGTSAEGPACGPGRQRISAWFQLRPKATTRWRRASQHCSRRVPQARRRQGRRHRQGHGDRVGKDYAVVDIGYKSEGQVPLDEFTQADGAVGIKAGDEVDVFLESRENDNGLCVLSKEKADRLKVWDEISGACERDELIEGTITRA